MCLYSMETFTRRIHQGETTTVGIATTSGGSKVVAAIPEPKAVSKRKQKKTGLAARYACVCLRNDDELRLTGLPEQFVLQHALVNNSAVVTFREGNHKDGTIDRVEFVNTEVVPFKQIPVGTKLTCLTLAENRNLKTVQSVVVAQPEPELVGVVASVPHVHAGVLSRNLRTGIGTGLGAMLALGLFSLLR